MVDSTLRCVGHAHGYTLAHFFLHGLFLRRVLLIDLYLNTWSMVQRLFCDQSALRTGRTMHGLGWLQHDNAMTHGSSGRGAGCAYRDSGGMLMAFDCDETAGALPVWGTPRHPCPLRHNRQHTVPAARLLCSCPLVWAWTPFTLIFHPGILYRARALLSRPDADDLHGARHFFFFPLVPVSRIVLMSLRPCF